MSPLISLLYLVVATLLIASHIHGLSIGMPKGGASFQQFKGIPIVNNSTTTDSYYQEYLFQGGECKMSSLMHLTIHPLYKPSESCVKVGPDNYERAYCTEKEFVIERDCDSSCKYCSGKSYSPIFTCFKIGLDMMHRVCGKLPSETIPKMLWKVQHENTGSDSECKKSRMVSAKGATVGVCEWSLFEPNRRSCNSTDYSIEKFTGGFDKCESRIGEERGKIGVCNEDEEYQCQ